MNLKEPAAVDERRDGEPHVVGGIAVTGHDLEEIVKTTGSGVARVDARRPFPGRRAEEREIRADVGEKSEVVGGNVVHNPRSNCDTGSAEFGLGDLLAERRLHDGRPCGEDGSVGGHHRKVTQWRSDGTVTG